MIVCNCLLPLAREVLEAVDMGGITLRLSLPHML